jgi:hypothetical protein
MGNGHLSDDAPQSKQHSVTKERTKNWAEVRWDCEDPQLCKSKKSEVVPVLK